jgi:Holliday junction resolvase
MKEQDIQTKILNKLDKLGHYSIKVIVASKSGVLDIVSCSPTGRFWSIEVKKPGEEPSKLQSWNIKQVLKCNGIAFWCDSYEDFLKKFNNFTIIETNHNKTGID